MSEIVEIRSEMLRHHLKRTREHINAVRGFCDKIAKHFPQYNDILSRKQEHDQSKLQPGPEMFGYLFVNWKYHCEWHGKDFDDCLPPARVDDVMHNATLLHVTGNSHHPEYHHVREHGFSPDIISRKDRDQAASSIVDGTSMPDLDLLEMCADWCAVSVEVKGNPMHWADQNIGVRWKFLSRQENLIRDTLSKVWVR